MNIEDIITDFEKRIQVTKTADALVNELGYTSEQAGLVSVPIESLELLIEEGKRKSRPAWGFQPKSFVNFIGMLLLLPIIVWGILLVLEAI